MKQEIRKNLVKQIKNQIKINGYFKFNFLKHNNEQISIKLNKFLNKGSEANVYNISEINNLSFTNKKIVAKVIVTNHEKNALQKYILKIDHVNIEKLFLIFESPGFSLLICEKLDAILSEFQFKKLDQILFVATEMIDALIYLHTKCKIAHCDIKENNIMYSNETRRFKLIDFNNCAHISEFKTFEIGINLFRRPLKVLKDGSDWGFDVDIWALGATLYNLFYNNELLLESRVVKNIEITNNEKRLLVNFYEKKIVELKQKNSIFYYFFILDDIKILETKLKPLIDKILK
jgi:serine/threonine protein kinase